MKNLIVLVIMIIIMSCSKEKEEPSAFVLNVNVEFTVLNSKGDDLLSSETIDYYPVDSMKLYYLINNEKVEVQDFDPQIGGGGIFLITETNPHRISITTYAHGDERLVNEEYGVKIGNSIAYLKLNNTDTDTIKTEWEAGDNYFINKKVWYNGVLQEYPDRPFEIIKDR